MKVKMKRSRLSSKDDIWNAVIAVLSEHDVTTEDQNIKEAFIAFQYYSELESGGHESLFTLFDSYLRNVGIEQYLDELNSVLEKIGAHDYAMIEKKYGMEMWQLNMAVDSGEIEDENFYEVVEKADAEYYNLEEKLEGLLETYFVDIYRDLIEVVED